MSDIFKFTIEINNIKYDNNLEEDLRVDRTNLDEDFAHQHERFAKYATLHELAKDNLERAKRMLDILYAQVDHEKRQEAKNMQDVNPKFKFTEKMCENSVLTDERYQKMHLKYLDAKKLVGVLGVGKEAFAQRKEMLISLGANQRVGATSTRVLEPQVKQIINNSNIISKRRKKKEQ